MGSLAYPIFGKRRLPSENGALDFSRGLGMTGAKGLG